MSIIKGVLIGVCRVGVFGLLIGFSWQNPDPHRLKSDILDKTGKTWKTRVLTFFSSSNGRMFSLWHFRCEPQGEMEMFWQFWHILTKVQQVVTGRGLNRAIVFKRCYPGGCHKRCLKRSKTSKLCDIQGAKRQKCQNCQNVRNVLHFVKQIWFFCL